MCERVLCRGLMTCGSDFCAEGEDGLELLEEVWMPLESSCHLHHHVPAVPVICLIYWRSLSLSLSSLFRARALSFSLSSLSLSHTHFLSLIILRQLVYQPDVVTQHSKT